MTTDIAAWIRSVHAALSPIAHERTGALWGPVRMRHRTTRPEWYGDFDTAWAMPIEQRVTLSGRVDVDVITASFADLPADLPPPSIRRGSLGPRGEVSELNSSPVRLTWAEHGQEVVGWDPQSGAAFMLRGDPPNGYDRVSPLRWLAHWSVVAAGGMLVHGACVGRNEGASIRGSLLLGEAGFGKSTTTLACVERGWLTCGDDAVAVFPDALGWHASGVYGAIKTKLAPGATAPTDLDPHTSPATVTWDVGGTKRVHLLTGTDAAMLAERIDLDSLVVLAPHASPTDPWHPMTPARARTLAAPSTAMSLPFDRETVLRRFGEVACEIPAYMLPRRPTMTATVSDVSAILNDSQPWISVIIPVYEGERFVADALKSVIAQTVGRFEIIVVDDGSPDHSAALAESHRAEIEAAGHRLVSVAHEHNRGIGQARASGLAAATAPLVAFLDQDDTWPIDRTARLLTALRRSARPLARGRMTFTDVMPGVERAWVRPHWFEGDHIGHVMGSILATRELFSGPGWINADMRTGNDDMDWFLRLRDAHVEIAEVEMVVLHRKVHDRNQSRRTVADQTDLFIAVREHLKRTRQASGSAGRDG